MTTLHSLKTNPRGGVTVGKTSADKLSPIWNTVSLKTLLSKSLNVIVRANGFVIVSIEFGTTLT